MLDIAPTVLTMYDLPVGEDMDGKVVLQAFEKIPNVAFIPSWEEVSGEDGRHPPHTRLDPVAAHEALEQMIALGYIERPDENHEIAVERTIRELRYNLGEAYQDAGRHIEARDIFTELLLADPDEQRFAVRLFVSCQALEMQPEMQRIVDDLDTRRRALFEQATHKVEALSHVVEELTEDQRRELARWRNLARFQPAVVDYLKAQLLVAGKRYAEALAALERVMELQPARPALLLQKADLYQRLGRWNDALPIYQRCWPSTPITRMLMSGCVGSLCGGEDLPAPPIRLSMLSKQFMTIRWRIAFSESLWEE